MPPLDSIWALALLLIDLLAVGLSAWHILLHKRTPSSALLWLNIVVLLPLVGTLLYVAFGVDRHGRRATIKELHNLSVRQQLTPVTRQMLPGPLQEKTMARWICPRYTRSFRAIPCSPWTGWTGCAWIRWRPFPSAIARQSRSRLLVALVKNVQFHVYINLVLYFRAI